ncbi:hypothetical protein BHE74_00058352, partial [Ensete ventricosum]
AATIEEEVVAVFLLAGDADNKEGQRVFRRAMVPVRKRKWEQQGPASSGVWRGWLRLPAIVG